MDAKEKKIAQAQRREAVLARKRIEHLRSRTAQVCVVLIAVLLAFALGFLARGFEPITSRLGFVSVPLTTTATQSSTKTVYTSTSARLSEVEDILSGSFDEINLEDATPLVLSAAVTSTNDPYMRYFTAERYDTYVRENTAKDYEGIGVLFSEYEDSIYVADVFSGSAADLAGVKEGDVLKSIDGVPTTSWTVNEVISTISQKSDSAVFQWGRPSSMGADSTTSLSTTLPIQKYVEPNITGSIEEENVGYISVSQLTSNAPSMVKSAVAQLQQQGAKSIVLDLRNCPGGYLTSAIDTASLFVKSGTLVQVKTSTKTTSKNATGSQVCTLPVVVLVNNKTSAAAEVLTAALKDNKTATVLGATTLGKGTVQVVQPLTFGGAIRYTAAKYLSPLGFEIDGVGITPDVLVDNEEDQKTVAVQTAKTLGDTAATASPSATS